MIKPTITAIGRRQKDRRDEEIAKAGARNIRDPVIKEGARGGGGGQKFRERKFLRRLRTKGLYIKNVTPATTKVS